MLHTLNVTLTCLAFRAADLVCAQRETEQCLSPEIEAASLIRGPGTLVADTLGVVHAKPSWPKHLSAAKVGSGGRVMEIVESLFGWVVVSGLILLLVGTGVGVMSTSPPEFVAARWFFTGATALLLLRLGLWLARAHSGIELRLVLAFLLFGAIGTAWVGALRWATVREERVGALAPKAVPEREARKDRILARLVQIRRNGNKALKAFYDHAPDGPAQIEKWREEFGNYADGEPDLHKRRAAERILFKGEDRITEPLKRLDSMIDDLEKWID